MSKLLPVVVSDISPGVAGLAGAPLISIPVFMLSLLSAELAGLFAPSISQDVKKKTKLKADIITENFIIKYSCCCLGIKNVC